MNCRHDARQFLNRCKEELVSKDSNRLKYAALELRMSMEALTYERALAYKDEFPPSEYETWQPRKLMSVLLDIDPNADKDCSLAIGEEEEYGVPAPILKSLGSEIVLNMAILKKHYDALGSYLHVQSMKQVRTGKSLNYDKIRSRCEDIAKYIEEVLSSTVFNVTLGNFATLNCIECGKPIRKRLPHGQSDVQAECYNCNASYTLIEKANGDIEGKPCQIEFECANSGCKQKVYLWKKEIFVGRHWKCQGCNGRNIIALGIRYEAQQL